MKTASFFAILLCFLALSCEQVPRSAEIISPEDTATKKPPSIDGSLTSIHADSVLNYHQKRLQLSRENLAMEQQGDGLDAYIRSSILLSEGLARKGEFTAAEELLDSTIRRSSEIDSIEKNKLLSLYLSKKRILTEKSSFLKDNQYLDQAQAWISRAQNLALKDSLSIARLAFHEGNYPKALDYLPADHSQSPLAIEILVYHGDSYPYTQSDSAIYFIQKAIDLNEKHSIDPFLLIKSYNLISYRYLGDHTRFLEYCQKANALNEQIFTPAYLHTANILKFLGVAYYNVGDATEAERTLNAALRCAEKNGDEKQRLSVLRNLAMIYSTGDQLKSIQIAKDILQFETDNYIVLNNLGIAYMSIDSFEQAERYQLLSLEEKIKQEGPGHEYVANSYFNLGQLYNAWGKHTKAKEVLLKALQMRLDADMEDGAALSNNYYHLGVATQKTAQYDAALNFYVKSIKALIPSYRPSEKLTIPSLDADIESKIQLTYPLAGIAETCYEKGKAATDNKQLLLATEFLQTNMALIDQIRGEYFSEASKQMLMEQARTTYELAWETTFELIEKGNIDEAMALKMLYGHIEKSKYVLLNDAKAIADAKFKSIPDSLIKKELALKEALAELEQELFIQKKEGKGNDLAGQIYNLKKDIDELNAYFKVDFPEYFQLSHAEIKSLEEVQLYLKERDNTAILEYALTDSSLYLIHITSSGYQIKKTPLDSTFWQDLEDMRRIVSNRPAGAINSEEWQQDYEAFYNSGRNLYQTLVGPIVDQLSAEKIIIIPDGKLGYLPFQLLLSQDIDKNTLAQGNYRSLPFWLKDKDIRYEYSASLLINDKNEREKGPVAYAGFAPSYQVEELYAAIPNLGDREKSELANLVHNKAEVQDVASLFGSPPYIGEKASKARFLEIGPQAQILHLSMHGLVHDKEPLYSHLAFCNTDSSAEYELYAYELYNMPLKADLAVLSACNTGAGEMQKGEGIMSLSRAFKYAGCPNIVMSLWPANELSSKKLVVGFFEQLKAGKQKDSALKEAQQQYLYEDRSLPIKKTHPFYWANFVLIGDDEALDLAASNRNAPYLIGGLGVLIILSLFLVRTRRRQKRIDI